MKQSEIEALLRLTGVPLDKSYEGNYKYFVEFLEGEGARSTQGKPLCPNHRIPLESIMNGIGQCPDSKVLFHYKEWIQKKKTEIKIVNGELVEVEKSEVKGGE